MTVLIAGGGIAGLALGLTLHQIGVPFRVYEASGEIRPLGVGINLQPNAVRELFDLGLEAGLDEIGVRTREYGFYSKFGHEIWVEPRGAAAGYDWPQFSVHRGKLQMLLYETLIARAGADSVVTGARAAGFETGDQAHLQLENETVEGDLIIACDGIKSAIRAQMVPGEGDPIWNGAVLWRAISRAPAFRGGSSMALIGHGTQRVVAYPISEPDPETGLCDMNWIAEKVFDPTDGWSRDDWNKPVDPAIFADDFADWRYDWFDSPTLIDGATEVLEYPMVDREPLDQWTHGRVTLLGDAAHATYPVGSNGASQAVLDARVLGAAFLEHGVGPEALQAYEAIRRPPCNAVMRANRGEGPDAVMQWVEYRCGGEFDNIEDVIPLAELAAHADRYKQLSGMTVEAVNNAPPLIPAGAKISA
ncbi:MAG: flavin-dependent oxidoreductase [Paracoccaceae bacterium]|jgi:5-methylphenazine-1-carboxylate 1-monooxygenase|nr:flavin-dependent oxidoreductase [Paracoccaceae bacterium]MDG1373288.1 flavin-dependent oxidoreductase [Paracoccaceae bacterium]MDG1972571.1 flavin-dependent oxidoreductase [Paracoccaceae bacterium]